MKLLIDIGGFEEQRLEMRLVSHLVSQTHGENMYLRQKIGDILTKRRYIDSIAQSINLFVFI